MASDNQHFLGIDYGAKRVGVALASHQTHMANPLATLDASHDIIGKLGDLVKQYHVSQIVLGLPRNLEGNDTPQTAKVRDFADTLKSVFNIPVELQDEALTTEAALEHLSLKHSGTINKEKVDAEAAAIILQDYLDSL